MTGRDGTSMVLTAPLTESIDHAGSFVQMSLAWIRHVLYGVALIGLTTPCVRAQTPSPETPAPSPEFLAHYGFQVSLAAPSTEDQRFSWDTHVGGDLDVVDYVRGRVNVLADYEAVLGSQFRAFDPNQGDYTLEASASTRAGGNELAGLFHHVSRHLSDRPKRFSIDWNVVGARVLRRFSVGPWMIAGHASAGRVIARHYVDYGWTADADVRVSRAINHTAGVFAAGTGEIFGVDRSIADRGRQGGGRIEAGVRVNGTAGAIELFAGVEQRVDAYPLDRVPQHWFLAGFRLVSP
jgi:hypothetical protein